MTKVELNFLLQKYHLSPNKLRGQHFLLDEDVLKNICRQAAVKKTDLVLEVGPGLGALTKYLIEQAGQVVAWEIEQKFRAPLEKLAAVAGNLDIYWQDILALKAVDWQKILAQKKFNQYKVVANIPYYLTGRLINKLILLDPPPVSITLLIQKEVAQRICDQKKNSLLSLAVAFYGQARLVALVPRSSFYPPPEVDSAILQISALHHWSDDVDEKKTWQLIRRGFAGKRKKLVNNLANDPILTKEKILNCLDQLELDRNIRAENLTVKNWLALAALLLK